MMMYCLGVGVDIIRSATAAAAVGSVQQEHLTETYQQFSTHLNHRLDRQSHACRVTQMERVKPPAI